MKNNVKRIAILGVALVLLLTMTAGIASAATIRVVPGPGTPIQAAVNAASAGDVIFVGAGTYTENVVVNKSVSIKGAGAKTTTVQGNSNNTVFTVTASDVSITGFTIKGADNVWQSGILVSGADNVRIANNVVERNAYGVFLWDSNAASIVNNVIRYNDAPRAIWSSRIDNGTGIIVWDDGGGADLNNLIINNDMPILMTPKDTRGRI
ncbi:MAG: NosD domain-containing protein [Chloroflexota bacterium]|nr:NosD domain-containing protein [Chloroflexota bacterium]